MEIDSVTYEIVDSVTWISVEERPRRLVVGKLTAAFREIGTILRFASVPPQKNKNSLTWVLVALPVCLAHLNQA